jgi:hypothetical protein
MRGPLLIILNSAKGNSPPRGFDALKSQRGNEKQYNLSGHSLNLWNRALSSRREILCVLSKSFA